MTYDPSFDYLLSEQVGIEPAAGGSADGYGDRTYGAIKYAQCRVEQVERVLLDRTGRLVKSMATLYIKPTYPDGTPVALTIADRLTMPSEYTPQQPRIIALKPENDEGGLSGALNHWEVQV